MKRIAIVSGLLAASATAALALGIFAAGKEGGPGFLGPGVYIADVNLALEILLLGGLTFGFFLARRGSIQAHRINQTVWVMVNAALVACIMYASLEDVKLKAIGDLADWRIGVTWLHAAIGTLTVAGGLWLILQMNDILPATLHVIWWKTLMRCTLAGYWLVALLGIATHILWYARPA